MAKTDVADRLGDRSSPTTRRSIDAWVNPNLGPPVNQRMNVGYLFPDLVARWERRTSLPQMIEEMDEAGVERALLCSGYGDVDDRPWLAEAISAFPDRFAASHVVDPRAGLDTIRLIDSLVNNDGYRMVRILGFETQIPYNDAQNYGVYAKCAELGIPVGLNVGIPGPLVPGKAQHPLSIDDVCAFFPELTIVMQHGGEPWVELCVKLMLKWENLHYMTSAFAPKHIPKPILHYANTRGAEKIMWASDYPLLTFDRCMSEIANLDFRDETRRNKFMYENARRMFFPSEESCPTA